MRVIKFRAWDGEDMIQYENLKEYSLQEIQLGVLDNSDDDYIEQTKVKIMQYTGLKDKNGKEIYEGDILKIGDIIGVIEWSGVEFYFECKEKNHWWNDDWNYRTHEIEVIGNIYENADLI